MPLFQASVRLQIHVDIAIVLANSMPLFQASVRLQLEGTKKRVVPIKMVSNKICLSLYYQCRLQECFEAPRSRGFMTKRVLSDITCLLDHVLVIVTVIVPSFNYNTCYFVFYSAYCMIPISFDFITL